jgi:hypothetical protein
MWQTLVRAFQNNRASRPDQPEGIRETFCAPGAINHDLRSFWLKRINFKSWNTPPF